MLLIDGVKYEEWVPEGDRAEEELEQIVKEHASEIFGENSIYVDIKHKLKSKAGTGTIPDGYVITFGDNPQLHIVEVELFNHSYDHIISQITKIITCLRDSNTWNDIARTIRDEINRDELTANKAKKAIQPGEVYEFLYNRISNLASLVIIIDKERIDVREGIGNITHRDIKMMEFRTFKRVGADAVHVHLFEPLYKPNKASPSPLASVQIAINSIEIELASSYFKHHYIRIPEKNRGFFPDSSIPLELTTDKGIARTEVYIRRKNSKIVGRYLRKGLSGWFKAHPEIKAGNIALITAIEPMKKYRLEIVK
jgi:predicted small metal-binding protein